MNNLRNYSQAELGVILKEWQEKPYHARQIFHWLYQKDAEVFEEMTDLSSGLRERLREGFSLQSLRLIKTRTSSDRTRKFLFGLADGNSIETVVIPFEKRNTACLSTQAGCKYGCVFCASGLPGFKRNLEAWEIIAQLLEINRLIQRGGFHRITHIVFMGAGEPLDNYDNTLRAIRIINSKDGFNIGARRITVSTSGVIPGIERLANEALQIELSVSLHAPSDEIRGRLMPINKRYPLKELISACRKYAKATKRQVTFEYVLIKGINCSPEAADNLAGLLTGWEAKVNILIYNPVKELPYQAADRKEAAIFRRVLEKAGIPVTLRAPRGRDIEGACGQLRLRQEVHK